jgi:hypothetical protein
MATSTEPLRTARCRHPLSAKSQARLLRSFQERAEAGDVPAIEALVRLNMTARTVQAG